MSEQLSADLESLKIVRTEGAPSSKKWVVYVLVFAVIAIGGIFGWKIGSPYVMAKLFKTEVSFTEISLLSPVQSSTELTATGYVVPQVISKVGTKTQGRVSKVFVKQGDKVNAGDVLLELEQKEQVSALTALKARLRAAKTRVDAAKASVDETKVQMERYRELAAKGAESASRAEDLGLRLATLKAQMDTASAEVRATAADLRSSQVGLDLLRILAPISGTVVTKPPELGEVLSPQTPVLELVDFSKLVVEIDVPESRLDKLVSNMPCEIVLDAFPGKRLKGRMVEIIPKVNRAKASASVKVRFQEMVAAVLPEMAARVNFLNAEPDEKTLAEKPKLFVSKEAVVKRSGEDVVFVVDDNKVKKVPVKLGGELPGGYELIQGPNAGTKIVKNPPETLPEGQQIKEKVD